MANIIKLDYSDDYNIDLVKKSLIGLRTCYPKFNYWFDKKVVPKLKYGSRKLFLATNSGEFSGAMILKSENGEKKICTLFVNPNYRSRHIGIDFVRIASEELETYKLPITVSDEAKDWFYKNIGFNFYTTQSVPSMYKSNVTEHIGYIMYHNPDNVFLHV